MKSRLQFLALLIFFGVLFAAFGQTVYKGLSLNESGVVVAPSNFWQTNATGIASAVSTNFAPATGSTNYAPITGSTNYAPIAPPYAVIYIPLPAGSQWTDFELKASTNNFTNVTTGMVFWYHSPDPTKLIITGQRWTVRPDVYFTDSGKTGTPNQRGWIKQNDTQSIFAMLTDANSEVGGFLIVIKDDLSAHRDHLVFSYSLLDASTGDKDPANRGVWRPVWPQEWVNSFDITNSSP